MTYAELKQKLELLTAEQLTQEVMWWGDERGGTLDDVMMLEEEHIVVDEFMEPRSAYADDPDFDEDSIIARLPAGTVIMTEAEEGEEGDDDAHS